MDFFIFLLIVFAYVVPMYVANAAPILIHGKTPLDFEKKFRGKRILGKGKTIIGTFAGIIIGSIAGLIFSLIFPHIFVLIPNYYSLIFILASGAMLGDIVESFIKRQMGIESGSFFPVFDQIDFIIGGFALSLIIRIPELEVILLIFIATIFVHLFFNALSFKLGLKKVPW
ncbi:MAG: CDP-2,3-bis-(O-geranylgeranyl)-sn-glycerol synthase [archaeon]|jgi:CDP-2,3-bis-(O-geranylgeranyl)-sn-glycerol synthase